MRTVFLLSVLLLAGCSDPLVSRSEAEDIAEDFASEAAARQENRIAELEARINALEGEQDRTLSILDQVDSKVANNARIANENALAEATKRGECGSELIQRAPGVIENRAIKCTAENYWRD